MTWHSHLSATRSREGILGVIGRRGFRLSLKGMEPVRDRSGIQNEHAELGQEHEHVPVCTDSPGTKANAARGTTPTRCPNWNYVSASMTENVWSTPGLVCNSLSRPPTNIAVTHTVQTL